MLAGVTMMLNVTDPCEVFAARSSASIVNVCEPSASSVRSGIAWPLASPCPASVGEPSSSGVKLLRPEPPASVTR